MQENYDIPLKFSTFCQATYTVFIAQMESTEPASIGDRKWLEKQAIARLLDCAGYDAKLLQHDPVGKPFLKNSNKHLSISHGNGWFVIAISDSPLGIDVERYRDSMLTGKTYFVNEMERNQTDLLAIWTAKEAFYKMLGGNIEDLKEEVTIQEVGETWIRLIYQDHHYLGDLFYLGDNYCTVFVANT